MDVLGRTVIREYDLNSRNPLRKEVLVMTESNVDKTQHFFAATRKTGTKQ